MNLDKSLADLKKEGWCEIGGVTCDTSYPASDHVIVEKDGKYLRHQYSVRDDDSDWPGEDVPVQWSPVELYRVTVTRCRSLP